MPLWKKNIWLYGAHEKDMNRASQSPFSHVIIKPLLSMHIVNKTPCCQAYFSTKICNRTVKTWIHVLKNSMTYSFLVKLIWYWYFWSTKILLQFSNIIFSLFKTCYLSTEKKERKKSKQTKIHKSYQRVKSFFN